MAESRPRLLHLGCGLVAPETWVNVDGSWNAKLGQSRVLRNVLRAARLIPAETAGRAWPSNIVVRDLRKRLPYGDGSFDGVYSSHFVEHLHRVEAVRLLREAYRLLKPGGVCRTLVPDLWDGVSEYVEGRAKARGEREYEDPARQLNRKLMLRKEEPWGGSLPVRMYRALYDYRSHKQMYDEESLILLMEEAGFERCERKGVHESALPHIADVEKPERVEPGGLAVEGFKPG